jgi:hypothetical protein
MEQAQVVSDYLHQVSMRKIVCLFLSLVVIQGCNGPGESVNPSEYLPLSLGTKSFYDVYEEVYASGQTAPAIKRWQERDEVTSVHVEGGRATFILTTSTRNTSADYWQPVRQYTIDRYPDKVVTTRDNRSTVTMIYPLNALTKWNANAYNTSEEEIHTYMGIGEMYKVGEKTYNNTLTVLERDYETIINFYKGLRVYAPGKGLIKDEQINFEYCQDDDCIGSETVESGYYRLKTLAVIDDEG